MSRYFDGQRDALPARVTGGFRLQEIRQREVEREAARRWPLLAAIDDHLWNKHVRRNAFERAVTPYTDDAAEGRDARGGTVFAMGGQAPWSNRR